MDEETELIAFAERLVTLRDAERGETYCRDLEIIDRRKHASAEASYQLHLKQTMTDFVTNELIGDNKIRIFVSFIAAMGRLLKDKSVYATG